MYWTCDLLLLGVFIAFREISYQKWSSSSEVSMESQHLKTMKEEIANSFSEARDAMYIKNEPVDGGLEERDNRKYTVKRETDDSETPVDPLFVPVKDEADVERPSKETIIDETLEGSGSTEVFFRGNKWPPHSSPDMVEMDSQKHFLKNSFSSEHETMLLTRSESENPLAVASVSTAHDTMDQEEPAERRLWKGNVEQQVPGERHCDLTEGSYGETYFESEAQQSGSLISSTNESHFKCTQCGNAFKQKAQLTQHMKIHTKKMPYVCCLCGKSFSRSTHLTRHMRVHTGERPFTCSECGKSFKNSSNLTFHMQNHSGEKPFRCNQCGNAFKRNEHLADHMRTHTGERPYKCCQCGKAFIQGGSLTRHMRFHTGDKPYRCSQCGRSFMRGDVLNQHLHLHTKDQP